MSFKDVWDKYSEVNLQRQVFIKRLQSDGTYESSWTEVDGRYVLKTPISGLQEQLPNTSWKFGAVSVGAASIQMSNPTQNFSSEQYAPSIFNGYIRDRSQIRVDDSLIDPDDGSVNTEIVFRGLIDADTAQTTDEIEYITALSFIKVLDDVNVNSLDKSAWYDDTGSITAVAKSTIEDGGFTTMTSATHGRANGDLVSIYGTENYDGLFVISNITANTFDIEKSFVKDSELDTGTWYADANVLSDVIYNLMNRSEFTQLFNVSASTVYINPSIDYPVEMIKYIDSTIFQAIEDMAMGLNVFYIDTNDNYFYFKPSEPTATSQYEFLEENMRVISATKMKEGTDRVYNSITWKEEPAITAVDTTAIRVKPINDFEIKGLVDNTYRQLVISEILTIQRFKRQYFELKIPYAPFFNVFDKVNVQLRGQAPSDVARWGFVEWGNFEWHVPVGLIIPLSDDWMIRGVKHSGLTTILELEEII